MHVLSYPNYCYTPIPALNVLHCLNVFVVNSLRHSEVQGSTEMF